ncbi:hypothetical protein NBRC10512_006643 [Rhodotorula toruloides]|uniref:Uncharacterized protein n=1 Tax=Rhodotorula toruloides (strain NP11) TaxID=1130832 RepID=M7XMI9_RHOT1|nr:uncharacterized protein RHTO_02846 [Rhodotorula toruloides NP11]EMS25119.1 hypothetical protein RHTO_02846 [Rhodotorula toruloides NP11]
MGFINGADLGEHWPALAQQAFMAGTCRAGQSISEWCSQLQDQCCGVICPNAPFTGPGTIIVFTVGTFFNLLWCLTWKSEATYNLFFQLLGADAAAVGLAVRLATEKNRLTAFHVSWLPFMLCSIVPIAIATCTVEKEYLHNISYPARLALRRRLLAEMPPVEMGRRHSAPESAAERRQAEDDLALQKERRMWIDEVMKNKPLLPPFVAFFFLAHLIGWTILFIFAYFFHRNPFQANCLDKLPLRQYSIILGCLTAASLLLAYFFAYLLIRITTAARRREDAARKAQKEHKKMPKEKLTPDRDVLVYLADLLHLRRVREMVEPTGHGWSKEREMIRFVLCYGIFFIWAICFIALYISALKDFLLIGNNPFDYGQVAACVNIIVPVAIVARIGIEQYLGWHAEKEAKKGWRRPLTNASRPGRALPALRLNTTAKPNVHEFAGAKKLEADVQIKRVVARCLYCTSSRPNLSKSRRRVFPQDRCQGENSRKGVRMVELAAHARTQPASANDEEEKVVRGCSGAAPAQLSPSRKLFTAVQARNYVGGPGCLCQVIPITGPGTVFAAIFGSLMNLCMALNWRSETSYTLAVQLLAADGAVISLIDRYFEPKNRLSLFHFCWVPMTVLSCIPIVVGMSITRLRYVHGFTQLGEKGLPETTSHGGDGRPSSRHSAHSLRELAHGDQAAQAEVFEDPATRYGNLFLTKVALWITLAHLVFFSAAFALVYASVSGFAQEKCIDKHNLQGWRIRMAVFSTVFLVVGYLFWFALLRALDVKRRQKPSKKLPRVVDGLDIVVWLFCAHLHSPASYTPWVLASSRRKNLLRWGISLAVWLGWAVGYIWLYIQAGNEFLMQGSNPWPYEQISGAFSVLAPLCLAARAYFEARDGYDHEAIFAEDHRGTRVSHHDGHEEEVPTSSESERHEELVRGPSSHAASSASGSRRFSDGFMSGGLRASADTSFQRGSTTHHHRMSSSDGGVSPRTQPKRRGLIEETASMPDDDQYGDRSRDHDRHRRESLDDWRPEEHDEDQPGPSRSKHHDEHGSAVSSHRTDRRENRPSRSSSTSKSLRGHIGVAKEWLKRDQEGGVGEDDEVRGRSG